MERFPGLMKEQNIRYKELSPQEVKAVWRWLKDYDYKLLSYERVVERQEAPRPIRSLKKMPVVMG